MTDPRHSDDCARTSRELVARHLPLPVSAFGRLVFLASLREPRSARHSYPSLSGRFASTEINPALRYLHEHVFAEWLTLTLEQQSADFALYLSSPDRGTGAGLDVSLFDALPPRSASDSERQLFLCDLSVVTALLENRHAMERRTDQPSSIQPDYRVLVMMEEARKEHGSVHLSLGSLSWRLRTSERHLGRLFKQCTGMGFREYLKSIRMLDRSSRPQEALSD